MRKFAAVTALALVISGCQQIADFKAQRAAARAAHDAEVCTGYGFKVGTDAYAQCLQNRDDQRRADQRAAAAAARANPPQTTTCSTVGASTTCQTQ